MRTDQGFVRRHKAVLRTGPLLALEASKLQRGPEWAAYELVGLALIAINAIIAHSVLAHGAPVAEVRGELRDAVLAVTPDADDASVDAVKRRAEIEVAENAKLIGNEVGMLGQHLTRNDSRGSAVRGLTLSLHPCHCAAP